jgi:ABC-type transport system involved in Fe-S cluster assembly fused permease/ATPase subunit
VPDAKSDELEGITLSVYLYAVKKGSPVGPRDVVKGAHLSSPSVAYRHLEKLEDLGLLQKNEFGEYVIKRKARVGGYVWVGRRMVPKMLVYSLVFMGILIVELVVFALHYAVETFEFKVFFLLITLITGVAMVVFTVEGFLQRRRFQRSIQTEQTQHPT